MNDANWDQSYAGAGLAESAAQIVKSIQDGDGWSIAANTGVAALDVLGVISDPVKALGTSAIGWLMEHIGFLDWFLDRTTGDPNAVQEATDTFFRAAQDLDGIAAEQLEAYGIDMAEFRAGGSPSAVAFEKTVGPRGDGLKTLSLQCLGLGSTMNGAGMLVAACRGMMRDLLAEFVWWVFRKAAIAIAAAPYTCGGSLSAFLIDTVIAAAKKARDLAAMLTELAGKLGGLFAKMRHLAGLLDSPAIRAAAVAVERNLAPAVGKAADDDIEPTAAAEAEQRVADYRPPGPIEITVPGVTEQKKQGPGLPSTWRASGTLDE